MTQPGDWQLGFKSKDWYSSITRTIEPSAGDGAWLDVGLQVDEAYDIEPMHDSVQKVDDWLTYDVGSIEGKTLYVGNPPFGRMGKLGKSIHEPLRRDWRLHKPSFCLPLWQR